jgi:hypothetical protein
MAEILLKIREVSCESGVLLLPSTKNQLVEYKVVVGLAPRAWGAQKKDVKNEGPTGNVAENEGNEGMADDRSGWFDENPPVVGENTLPATLARSRNRRAGFR